MVFTDSHAHLTMEAFDADREEVLQRARSAGLRYICTIASPAHDIPAALALAGSHEFVSVSVGLHPHDARVWSDAIAAQLERAAEEPCVVALGEIGLDYHYDRSPREIQRLAFREQIRLARRLGLPLAIHTREAHEDTLRILEEEKGAETGGVFHCFSGSREMAEFALANGFFLSFSGSVTFRNAAALREVAAGVPPGRLLTETDAPFLSPHPHRGRRNEPARTLHVVETLADLHGIPAAEMGERTTANFEAAFPRLRRTG
jgi:TatD DNase family protein